MKRLMVRYKVKSERVAEHERLIADVFAELERTPPEGLRYSALKQSDGVSFVHIALIDAAKNPLNDVAAFAVFSKGIAERCDEPPVALEYTEVAGFRL